MTHSTPTPTPILSRVVIRATTAFQTVQPLAPMRTVD